MSIVPMVQNVVLMTVGYEGRTADEVVQLLDEAKVDVLVDVRLTPLSRKPGLSKRRLAGLLDDAGVGYLHLPALGNPKANRDGFRRGEQQSRDTFREVLASPPAQAALEQVRKLLCHQRVALLCFERDAESCHRKLVIDSLVDGVDDSAV
jgi:uncharacterized protein (DUF488 family)